MLNQRFWIEMETACSKHKYGEVGPFGIKMGLLVQKLLPLENCKFNVPIWLLHTCTM